MGCVSKLLFSKFQILKHLLCNPLTIVLTSKTSNWIYHSWFKFRNRFFFSKSHGPFAFTPSILTRDIPLNCISFHSLRNWDSKTLTKGKKAWIIFKLFLFSLELYLFPYILISACLSLISSTLFPVFLVVSLKCMSKKQVKEVIKSHGCYFYKKSTTKKERIKQSTIGRDQLGSTTCQVK